MKTLDEKQLSVTSTASNLPNIPQDAVRAILTLERGSGTSTILARFKESGEPSPSSGLPLGELGRYDVMGKSSLSSFKIISADGNEHILHIQYKG